MKSYSDHVVGPEVLQSELNDLQSNIAQTYQTIEQADIQTANTKRENIKQLLVVCIFNLLFSIAIGCVVFFMK